MEIILVTIYKDLQDVFFSICIRFIALVVCEHRDKDATILSKNNRS